jgi:hypothetical protein
VIKGVAKDAVGAEVHTAEPSTGHKRVGTLGHKHRVSRLVRSMLAGAPEGLNRTFDLHICSSTRRYIAILEGQPMGVSNNIRTHVFVLFDTILSAEGTKLKNVVPFSPGNKGVALNWDFI